MTKDIDDLVGKEFGSSKAAADDREFHDVADMLNIDPADIIPRKSRSNKKGKPTEDEQNLLKVNGVPIGNNGNGKDKSKNSKSTANNNLEENQQQKKQIEKRIKNIVCYKYSRRGKSSLLYEAIILAGKPVFITYNCEIQVVKKIEEQEQGDRIIKPPYQEECPYECYEFENLEEIKYFVNQAKSISSIGQLYLKAKELVKKYNDQDNDKLVLIALDIIFSYFQDKFATTHYVSIVGDNDSGKSSLGITFEALAYRPVYMTDPSAANIFRCLGTVEPGQCTIILDEADKIDKCPEMMAT